VDQGEFVMVRRKKGYGLGRSIKGAFSLQNPHFVRNMALLLGVVISIIGFRRSIRASVRYGKHVLANKWEEFRTWAAS
jgi:hypothetical protein